MWPEKNNTYHDRDYIKVFHEERLPLTEFKKDVSRAYKKAKEDPFYVEESVVRHYVPRPYDTDPSQIQSILETARGMGDMLNAMGHMLTLFDYMHDEFLAVEHRLNMVHEDVRTLKIDNMGPTGPQGLTGPRGEPGPPGPPVDEELKKKMDQALAEMHEAMEVLKDMQEQIDDIAEEL